MAREFLHFKCLICGKKVHKKGICSDCMMKPTLKQEIKNRKEWNRRYMD